MASAAEFPIDLVMERIEARMHAPETSPLDIYVWSDGRVTGPPTGHEPDEARLVTLVSPVGSSSPDLAAIRLSIEEGLETAPEEPDVAPVDSTEFEEVPAAEASSANGAPQGQGL